MQVILLQDVKKQGKKDQIINVSDGYANNFLIKKGLAVPVTETSKKVLDNELEQRRQEEEALVKKYQNLADNLKQKTLIFKVKTGKDDRVFGNISTKQISEELKKMGYTIDKKCIHLNAPIDSLGTHKIEVELHKKVIFELNITLRKE